MKAKKIVSMVTATSVLALSMSGCALLGGKDKAAIEEVVLSYVDYIKDGKTNKSLDLVVDEEDYFQENELPAQQAELISAVFEASEITVENVKVNKDSASAEVVFAMPDLESIADEGYSFDEFVDAIGDIDETVEESFEFDLSKDGEDWLIEGDSTKDFYDFLMGIGDGIEFSGLSEGAAIEAVDAFIAYLAQGDTQGVLAMSPEGADIYESFDEMVAMMGDDSVMSNVFSAYFSRLDYEATIGDVTEDSITVLLDGTAPDVEPALTAACNDQDVMAPVVADYLETMINGTYDYSVMISGLMGVLCDAIDVSDDAPYSSSIVVTADDEGNYYCEPADDFMMDFEFPDVSLDNEATMAAALDLLLEQGRISQGDYNSYMSQFGGGSVGSDGNATDVLIVEGDDLYYYEYSVSSDMIYLDVQTWDYYDIGDTFEYSVDVNGTSGVMDGEYTMSENSSDWIEIQIPAIDPAGDYVITVYDEGSSSSVLIKIEIIILEEGAPVPSAGDPVFGASMNYGNTGDDFYSFHFTDGNGEWVTTDTYPSNRGAIDFYVITWEYYDVGSIMVADVYYEGDIVGSVSATNSSNGTDTFEFSYEPLRLEDGDYIFRIYNVEDPGVLVDAYVTVETD